MKRESTTPKFRKVHQICATSSVSIVSSLYIIVLEYNELRFLSEFWQRNNMSELEKEDTCLKGGLPLFIEKK